MSLSVNYLTQHMNMEDEGIRMECKRKHDFTDSKSYGHLKKKIKLRFMKKVYNSKNPP